MQGRDLCGVAYTAIATYSTGRQVFEHLDLSGAWRVATSPIMINASLGGSGDAMVMTESVAGMPTIWNSRGKHIFRNVHSRFHRGFGVNLEKCQAGFEFE